MRQKGFAGIFVLVLVFIVAVAGGAYYLGRITTKPQVTETNQAIPATPLPSKASATEGDPSANWKTYTSEALAFSLKIPPDWSSFEANDRVDFAKGGKPYPLKNNYWVWVSVVPNTNQLSTEQVVDNYLTEIPEVVGGITKDYLTVSGANAISLYPVPSATDTKDIYIATKENIYSIVLQAGSLPDLNQEAMNAFNMVLSTFKFTSQ